MSDEDLLIGSQKEQAIEGATQGAQGSSGIVTPKEIMSLSVFGVYENGEAIEQKMKFQAPRGTHRDQCALFIWDQISKLGGLTTTGTEGEYNFYPLQSAGFKRLTLKFNNVVGVTLG